MHQSASPLDLDALYSHWKKLDKLISSWWDQDIKVSREEQVRDAELNKIWYADDEHRKNASDANPKVAYTLLYLPFPYITPGGSERSFPEMYAWDSYFINLGLAAHGRYDIIEWHVRNHLFMIERYGMVLTGNRSYYLGRSQTPLHPASIALLHQVQPDQDLIARAYALLKQEYNGYWMATHHHTESGLATNCDLSDPVFAEKYLPVTTCGGLRPALCAEAEVLDFTAIFDGDVRRCNPLQTNCALVRYAATLSSMARELGWMKQAEYWRAESEHRAARIRDLCWDEKHGFFFEYNFKEKRQLPFWSIAAYWTLWAGVANKNQAERLVEQLPRFDSGFGLAQTDRAYPSPHPEFQALQWDYPSGWPPSQMMVVEALEAYGFQDQVRRIAANFLQLMMAEYHRTGKLWEKFNVAQGNLILPRERYGVVPMHGWSSAAVVYLGRKLFE